MAWMDSLIGAAGKGMFEGIGTLAKDIRTAITGKEPIDSAKAAEIALQMAAIEAAMVKAAADFDTAQMQGQNATNLVEAQGTDKFASRWRPAVGWVCVSGLGYTFILKPLLPWCVAVGAIIVGRVSVIPPLPSIDIGELVILLGGMLGLGTMRSVERIKLGGGK